MAWRKIDDTTTVADQPLSSYLGIRLTQNVNSYPSTLRRSATFAWPCDETTGEPLVKWASYYGDRGTVITVDVGVNATAFTFLVNYQTTNALIGGKVRVRHLDSGAISEVTAFGSATPTYIEVPYTTAQPLSGPQGFFISFVSDISGSDVGRVEPVGAAGNQVFCEPAGGAPFPFTTAVGSYTEMYHLLKIDPTVLRPAPRGNALLNYQIVAFKHNVNVDRPPHGVCVVWPMLEIDPPILPTSTVTTGTKIGADVWELGRLELFSVTVTVDAAVDYGLLPPTSYAQATPFTAVASTENTAMMALQPNAGSLLSSGGFLGKVLLAGDNATFAFYFQTDETVATLNVSFQCVSYNADQDTNPDITFSVRDYQNNTVGTDVVRQNVNVPRINGQPTRTSDPDSMVAMNGVLAGDGLWGMRDCMPMSDAMKGAPVRFTWGPNAVNDFKQATPSSTNAVYHGVIYATCDLYIYGFNVRVL